MHIKSGNIKEAEIYLLKSIKIRKEKIGELSHLFASTYANLGSLYIAKRDLKKAQNLVFKGLNIHLYLSGENIDHVALCYIYLGELYLFKQPNKNSIKAKNLLNKAYNILLQFFGMSSQHELVFFALQHLTTFHSESGNMKNFEKTVEKLFSMPHMNFNQNNLLYLIYAQTFLENGNLDKARQCFLKYMNIFFYTIEGENKLLIFCTKNS